MNTTAQELFSTLQQLQATERQQFFILLANSLGNQEDFSHEQVFGQLETALFTATEAAEYLEISMATFRRYLKTQKIVADSEVGSTHLYSLTSLRGLKQALRLTRRV
jgi:response regulator of citrate/malate metabolism